MFATSVKEPQGANVRSEFADFTLRLRVLIVPAPSERDGAAGNPSLTSAAALGIDPRALGSLSNRPSRGVSRVGRSNVED